MSNRSMAALVGAQPGDWDSGGPPLLHTAPGILPLALTRSSTRNMLINSSSAVGHQAAQCWGWVRKRGLFSLGQRCLQSTKQQDHGAYREGTEKAEPGSEVFKGTPGSHHRLKNGRSQTLIKQNFLISRGTFGQWYMLSVEAGQG